MKRTIFNFALILAALLLGASCEDDIGIDYESCWANERDDRFYFIEEFGEGTLCVYQDHQLLDKEFYNYSLKRDSIFLFPSFSSNWDDTKGYPFKLEGNRFTIYGFEGIVENSFKRK